MFRLLFLTVAVLIGIAAALPVKVKPVTQGLKIKWKQEIGNLTDRSRPVISNGFIWIGSNGSRYNDYALDYGNGIYKIAASNGNIAAHFLDEQVGDMDVNGLVKINELFYAGSDNEELSCFDASGKVKWRIPTGGDIEHRPTHVKLDGKDALIYATENGEISAIDPASGKRLWSFYHSTYKGWKPGENRFVFKVNSHFSADFCFFSEPAIADLNRDGTDDVIYNANFQEIIAVSGRTGRELFSYRYDDDKETNILIGRNKPLIATFKNELVCWIPLQRVKDQSYELRGVTNKGEVKYRKPIGKVTNLYLSQNSGMNQVALDNGFIDLEKDFKLVPYKSNESKKDKESNYGDVTYSGGRYADNKIKMNGELCNVVLFESSPEGSTVLVVGQKTCTRYLKQVLPDGSECIPVVQDIDSDGKLELLVGCRDGNLYCYSMGATSNQLVKP
jgi:outer membrane protein assembly factor BamB